MNSNFISEMEKAGSKYVQYTLCKTNFHTAFNPTSCITLLHTVYRTSHYIVYYTNHHKTKFGTTPRIEYHIENMKNIILIHHVPIIVLATLNGQILQWLSGFHI